MARPALIEKLMQPAKWLFKKELIPLDDIAGSGLKKISDKLNVDFSEMPAAQLGQMVLPMIQTGGGLMVDSQGKIYFDPESMDTAVFDRMLKALRLPKWLTANTNFYVDKSHANASDTLDEGRGLTADKPFKTIQACVDYVCENFNVGPYTVHINISEDIYKENLCLPDYSRTSGKIVLRSNDIEAGYVKLTGDFSTSNLRQIMCTGGIWEVLRPKIYDEFDYDTVSYKDDAEYVQYIGFYSYGGDLTIIGPYFDVTLSGTLANELRFYAFYVEDSKLSIQPDVNLNSRLYMNDSVQVAHRSKMAFLSTGQNSILAFAHDNSATEVGKTLRMDGDFDRVATAINKGSIFCGTTRNVILVPSLASGKKVSGIRYVCKDGGTIDMKGRGAEFFPGTEAGTVEESTYSWYK